MKIKNTLKNIPFIYKDGNHYKFNIFEHSIEGDVHKISVMHEIYVYKRKKLTIRLFKWTKNHYYYMMVGEAIKINLNLNEHFSTHKKIIGAIENAIDNIEKSKIKKQTHLELVFSKFDGFISVPDAEKSKFKRINSIEDILK